MRTGVEASAADQMSAAYTIAGASADVCNSCRPGHVLAQWKQQITTVVVLKRGVAALSRPARSNSIIGIRGAGTVVGLNALFGSPRHSATVTAVTPCDVLVVSLEDVRCRIRESVDACQAALLLLSCELQEQVRTTSYIGAPGARARVGWIVSELLHKVGDDGVPGTDGAECKVGVTSIAALAGTSRETASRVIAALIRKRHLLRTNGRFCAPADSPLLRR